MSSFVLICNLSIFFFNKYNIQDNYGVIALRNTAYFKTQEEIISYLCIKKIKAKLALGSH